MRLLLDKKKYDIPPVSSLSFNEFNKMMVKSEVFDLKEYISCFVDMPVKDLMEAEIKSTSLPALYYSLFDTDIKDVIKSVPATFKFNNEIYIVKELTLSTFGKNYVFDLFFERFKTKKINEYELCLYALSCAISKEYSTSEVQVIYSALEQMNWKVVLPASFFLVKRFLKQKRNFLPLWVIYTTGLNRMKRLSMYKTTTYKRSVKKLLPKFWLK